MLFWEKFRPRRVGYTKNLSTTSQEFPKKLLMIAVVLSSCASSSSWASQFTPLWTGPVDGIHALKVPANLSLLVQSPILSIYLKEVPEKNNSCFFCNVRYRHSVFICPVFILYRKKNRQLWTERQLTTESRRSVCATPIQCWLSGCRSRHAWTPSRSWMPALF